MMLVAKLGLQLACDIQRLAVTEKDAFDLWWEWADKPVDNKPTIDAAIYDAVMALPPDERRDRAKVNDAVRDAPEERRDR